MGRRGLPLNWVAREGFRETAEMSGGKEVGMVEGKGVVDVGAELIWCSMRMGTVSGDTFSMIVKDGRRRIVVGSEGEWCSSGRGMFEADSINFCSRR